MSDAADGPGALAAARANAPDVMVLDVMLPGLDGLEVCRQLRTFSDAYVLLPRSASAVATSHVTAAQERQAAEVLEAALVG